KVFECQQPTERQIAEALKGLKSGFVIEQAKTISRQYAEQALANVKKLPPSLYRNGLKTLVQLIIDRDF
ncbi:MAG TPA: hypothetical protein VE131_10580, partial [Terriglobales bacterium]|nr:hypothetical protein [Terriglobales bacterium]